MSSCNCSTNPTENWPELRAKEKRTSKILVLIFSILFVACLPNAITAYKEMGNRRDLVNQEILAKTNPTRTGTRIMTETFSNDDACFVRVTEYFPRSDGTFVGTATQTEKDCSSKK